MERFSNLHQCTFNNNNNNNNSSRLIWQFSSSLSNTNKIDKKMFFCQKNLVFWLKGQMLYCCTPSATLIKLSKIMGLNGSSLFCFDGLISFFKILNSSADHSSWGSLNVLNSACSIFLTVTLLEISIVYNFRF